MSRLHTVDPSTILETRDYKVVTLDEKTGEIKSLIRKRDEKTFSVGDYVTNGTQMKGYITAFEPMLSEGSKKVSMWVSHTWSGVGMHLDNLKDARLLPSKFQIGNEVAVRLGRFKIDYATVLKVHFTDSKEQYDLEIPISTDNVLTTRIYNVDATILEPYRK